MQSFQPDIATNLHAVRERIRVAAAAAGRDPARVTLIAASKTKPAGLVRAAHAAGATDFGENYLQEALPKIAELADLALTWHFIGRIQSNKTADIARHFDWVHTVDREGIAARLSHARSAAGNTPLQVCLQVNVDADPDKAGLAPHAVADTAQRLADLPGLQLRGLMTILALDGNPAASFESVAELFAGLKPAMGGSWDTLSMGMTQDMAAAIHAGATHVRVGTAIFGARERP